MLLLRLLFATVAVTALALAQAAPRANPVPRAGSAPRAGHLATAPRAVAVPLAPRQLLTRANALRLVPRAAGRLKVVVLGAAIDEKTIDPGLKSRLEELGRLVARRHGLLITGAPPGVPQVVARAAHRAGGTTIGISPAGSLREHRDVFRMPTESLSILELTGTGQGMGFIEREAPLVERGDILVYANGRSGTLGELLAGMHLPKVIALLEGSGGVAGAAAQRILPHLGEGKAVIVSDADPARLLDKAVRAHQAMARVEEPLGAATMPPRGPVHPVERDRAEGGQARDVFAFLGHARGLNARDRRHVNRLAELIARGSSERQKVLVVPARGGLTARFAAKVRAAGVATVGVSPAASAAEHARRGLATRGLSRLFFTGQGAGIGEFSAQRAVIEDAHVVFVAGGDYKSLGATIFAMYHDTVIAVLETNGLSGKLRDQVFATFDKKSHATVVYDSDPARLFDKAMQAAEIVRANRKAAYLAPE